MRIVRIAQLFIVAISQFFTMQTHNFLSSPFLSIHEEALRYRQCACILPGVIELKGTHKHKVIWSTFHVPADEKKRFPNALSKSIGDVVANGHALSRLVTAVANFGGSRPTALPACLFTLTPLGRLIRINHRSWLNRRPCFRAKLRIHSRGSVHATSHAGSRKI